MCCLPIGFILATVPNHIVNATHPPSRVKTSHCVIVRWCMVSCMPMYGVHVFLI